MTHTTLPSITRYELPPDAPMSPVFPGRQRSFPPSERGGDKEFAAIAAWRRGWDSNPHTLSDY